MNKKILLCTFSFMTMLCSAREVHIDLTNREIEQYNACVCKYKNPMITTMTRSEYSQYLNNVKEELSKISDEVLLLCAIELLETLFNKPIYEIEMYDVDFIENVLEGYRNTDILICLGKVYCIMDIRIYLKNIRNMHMQRVLQNIVPRFLNYLKKIWMVINPISS